MSNTLYRKDKNRYIPVAEYGEESITMMQHGVWVVISQPGLKQTMRVSDKHFDPMRIATLTAAAQEIADELRDQDQPKPAYQMTPKQKAAWDAFMSTMPREFRKRGCLQSPSLRESILSALEKIK